MVETELKFLVPAAGRESEIDIAAGIAGLADARRQRARKRLERLRYSVEFFAPLFLARSVKPWLAQAHPAQDVLGRFKGLALAEAAFNSKPLRDSR